MKKRRKTEEERKKQIVKQRKKEKQETSLKNSSTSTCGIGILWLEGGDSELQLRPLCFHTHAFLFEA